MFTPNPIIKKGRFHGSSKPAPAPKAVEGLEIALGRKAHAAMEVWLATNPEAAKALGKK
jgi:hypothetical protein